jgi:hypothetical protein
MTAVESAAIDAMLTMKIRDVRSLDNGVTELTETPAAVYIPKLSSWITHHQAIFGTTPTEEYFNVSAHVIADLMKKLDCPVLQIFPTGGSAELKQLERLFMTGANGNTAGGIGS